MRFLLDTHVFLWWAEDPASLSKAARAAITPADNIVFLSPVSTWEIAIKAAAGKIALDSFDRIYDVLEEDGFSVLAVTIPHTLEVAELPPHHRDPFDRLLIAQARVEHLTLITRDEEIMKYNVPTLLA